MRQKKAPEVWDDCKTKEEKQAFMDELDRLSKTQKTIPFDKVIFDHYVKEATKTKKQRLWLYRSQKLLRKK